MREVGLRSGTRGMRTHPRPPAGVAASRAYSVADGDSPHPPARALHPSNLLPVSQHLYVRVLRDLSRDLPVADDEIRRTGDRPELAAKERVERSICVIRALRPAIH